MIDFEQIDGNIVIGVHEKSNSLLSDVGKVQDNLLVNELFTDYLVNFAF
ncbi:MAG: hypothetical protein AAGF83_12360 [Cyanobacteria bacterium P01_G01_bin.67]